jgi:hypothetical protein
VTAGDGHRTHPQKQQQQHQQLTESIPGHSTQEHAFILADMQLSFPGFLQVNVPFRDPGRPPVFQAAGLSTVPESLPETTRGLTEQLLSGRPRDATTKPLWLAQGINYHVILPNGPSSNCSLGIK